MRRNILRFVMLLLAAAPAGCATFVPPPFEGPVAVAAQGRGLDAARVEHGRELFVTSCTKCHSPVRPDSFSEENWDDILPKMVKRAKLDAASHADIRAYVFSARDAMIAAKQQPKQK